MADILKELQDEKYPIDEFPNMDRVYLGESLPIIRDLLKDKECQWDKTPLQWGIIFYSKYPDHFKSGFALPEFPNAKHCVYISCPKCFYGWRLEKLGITKLVKPTKGEEE